MKTMVKFTVGTALMFATVAGMAKERKFVNDIPNSDTEWEVLESADKGKPIFQKKGDKVYLNMLNLQGEKVVVRVFDSSRRLLFKETFEEALTVEKAFNFENAFEDSYTVVVKDAAGTYTEEIIVK